MLYNVPMGLRRSEIIADGVPEIEEFMQEVLPDVQADGVNDQTDI